MTINDNNICNDISIDLSNCLINLPKVRNIKIDNNHNIKVIDDKIIRALVERIDNNYYVSIYLENELVIWKLDVDIDKIMEEYFNSINKLENYEKRLKGLEYALSRRKKGSNNYLKMELKIQKQKRK